MATPDKGCDQRLVESAPGRDIIDVMVSEHHTFESLFELLSARAVERPAGSTTVDALDRGIHFLGKKVLEEAGEVWLAAEQGTSDELAAELSQLLYWMQVVMVDRGLTPADVYRYL